MTDKTRYHQLADKLENSERRNEELKAKIVILELQISELKTNYGLTYRLKLTWHVFTGKADALYWPED